MNGVLDGLGGLSATAWWSAGFAVLAVLGLVRPPAGRFRATKDRLRDRWRVGPPTGSLPLIGRPGGPGVGRRLVLGALTATGLCLAASTLDSSPGAWVWLGWPLVTLLVAGGLGVLQPRAVRVRRERLVRDTPQALDLLAAGLAAGMPVRVAGRAVVQAFDGPIGEDVGRVLALADLGVAEAEAWRSLAGHPQLGPAAQDLARSVESGTLMVEALERHAAAAREAGRSALVVRARSVGVRSVLPLMICFIPAFLLLGVVPTVVSALTAALG
jgi:hypothetical protein